jgi:hypothetical protein
MSRLSDIIYIIYRPKESHEKVIIQAYTPRPAAKKKFTGPDQKFSTSFRQK